MEVIEFLVRGLLLGATYGVIAIPISLVFVTTGTVDLAIGAYVVLAAAIAYAVPGLAGWGLGIGVAMLAAAGAGVASALLVRRYSGDKMIVILASFGIAILIESLVLTVFGKSPFVRMSSTPPVEIAGILLSRSALISAAIGVALAGVIYVMLYRSAAGRVMRAGADNSRGAAIAGIPVKRVQFGTFVMGGTLAGIAGIMLLNGSGLMFSSALPLSITSLGAAILFGLHRPLHAFLGGLVIGVIEALSAGFASSSIATLLPLLFIFLVLATRSLRGTDVGGGRA